MLHNNVEEEKKRVCVCVCAWHTSTAQRSGRQTTKVQQHEQARCVSPSPSPSFSSARTCSGNTNHTCSHADSLSLPHSLSSLGLAQVESMLSSCAADHGHHTMHACQWPTPPPQHRLAMTVATPLLRAVVWKEGCPPTACVRVCVRWWHSLLHPPLCIQCVWVHTFVC